MLNLAFLQYYFSEGEHTLKYAPHGNSESSEPYIRTMPSMLCKVKKKAKETTAKHALKYLSNEAGSIFEATTASSLPRGRQQINDARRKGINKAHDPLYAVMYMCKEAEGQKCKESFVRTVNAAPFPMAVLAFDYTFDDLVRFCTGEKHCIFGVDPTFNLGKFDVTVTTYQHLLLQHKGDSLKKSPTLLGPMFIHVCKDFASYHFFSSFLVGQRPQLRSIKAFGTDGELALENALSATFADAQHVRCFLYFKGNVERKLQELNIPSPIRAEITKDVMGNPLQLQYGLVDAESPEQLDDLLSKLKGRWNELERPYNSPPFFHTWFLKHCRDTISQNMLPQIRLKASLGYPPMPYYTNEVESKNKF